LETDILSDILFQLSNEAIIICSASSEILAVNPAFTRITGYSIEEAVGQNPSFLSAGKQDGSVYREMWRGLLEDGAWSGELWNKRKDGRGFIERITIRAERPTDGSPLRYVGIFDDFTSEKVTQEKLRYRTYHDSLTHLFSRNYIELAIELYVANFQHTKTIFSLVYLSIDSFQVVNDLSGQQQGDEALRIFSERLVSSVKMSDIVGRVGGDEFCVILEGLDNVRDLKKFTEKLRQTLMRPINVKGISHELSSSIGILTYLAGSSPVPEDLMRDVAQAATFVKRSGGDGIRFFDQEVHQQAEREAIIHNGMKLAIERGELSVFYQRIERSTESSFLYFEALVRWLHPEMGLVSPLEFIPVAEKNSYINRLGEFVVESVCRQIRSWVDQYDTAIKVAINISAVEFSQRDVVGHLLVSLNKYQLDVSHVGIEVTESQMLETSISLTKAFSLLREHNITISLDDFGTGYSSLAYLKNIPVDILKIDREFIKGIDEHERDLFLVISIIEMGHRLNLKVVAEGVETERQFRLLQIAGCDFIQGYFISRPAPADDLIGFFDSRLAAIDRLQSG